MRAPRIEPALVPRRLDQPVEAIVSVFSQGQHCSGRHQQCSGQNGPAPAGLGSRARSLPFLVPRRALDQKVGRRLMRAERCEPISCRYSCRRKNRWRRLDQRAPAATRDPRDTTRLSLKWDTGSSVQAARVLGLRRNAVSKKTATFGATRSRASGAVHL